MEKTEPSTQVLRRLLEKGVKILCPESIEIGEDVNPDRISADNVTIHSGCRIYGADTLIMPGARIGFETPATIINCQVGKNVELKGGLFSGSTFLDGSAMGSGAHIRPVCLLEEEARGAHTVGLKQTILFPYVTLGSLINFCDCLMAGGTDRNNHSEVGSSYIHFNYTQNQDKATASLIGDVPGGVMINRPPIFLGGQGGIVGPVKIQYGTVVAAGTIVRKDIKRENRMLLGSLSIAKSMPFYPNVYSNISRIIELNSNYIANLIALRRWYLDIRVLFLTGDMETALHRGAVDKIESAINERLKQLKKVADRMPESIEVQKSFFNKSSEKTIMRKKEFTEKWPEMEGMLTSCFNKNYDSPKKEDLLKIMDNRISQKGKDYITVVKGLKKEESEKGSGWLQGIVDKTNSLVREILPSFKDGER
jgi:UDP-N-acetylglucosamine/UDP-N-acetylgalactosamine diphosphorylase